MCGGARVIVFPFSMSISGQHPQSVTQNEKSTADFYYVSNVTRYISNFLLHRITLKSPWNYCYYAHIAFDFRQLVGTQLFVFSLSRVFYYSRNRKLRIKTLKKRHFVETITGIEICAFSASSNSKTLLGIQVKKKKEKYMLLNSDEFI